MTLDKRNKEELIVRMKLFLDLCLTVAAFIAAYFIRKYLVPEQYTGLSFSNDYYIVMLIIVIVWGINLVIFDVYDNFISRDFFNIYIDVFKSVTVSTVILFTSLYIFKMKDISRLFIGIFYVIDMLLLFSSKKMLHISAVRSGLRDHNVRNILIIGSRARAEGAIGLIKSSKREYAIIGCLDIESGRIGREVKDGVKVIGTMDDLKHIILNHVVDEVIFAMPLKKIESVDVYMLLIEVVGIRVRIFPDWHIYSVLYKPGISSIVFDDFHGIPTMLLTATSTKHRDLMIKSMFDYTVSALLLFVLSPVLMLIAALIMIISPHGSVLFKQERVGLNGRKFMVYKFRTMVPDAEERLKELVDKNEASGPVFKITKDPRIIPFLGSFLRKTSLDELPQLFNVFKGEMSLIGPRPPIQSEVDRYDVWQRRRLSMKPGMTCIWQVQPNRNDLTFHEWMTLVLKYIDNWSIALDIRLLWDTVKVVLTAEGR